MAIKHCCDASRVRHFILRSAMIGFGCLSTAMLSGCGDETAEIGDGSQSSAPEAAAYNKDWLELSSAITPAQWLVSRGKKMPAPLGEPEVQRVSQQLAAAHKRYRESERMIANRSVQLSDMLRQIGIAETASQVLDDLVSIGGEVGQTEGFGAISQYYFNLRAASTPRADALSTLKTRYGSKS
jgi:hypothetical protein